MDLRVHKDDLIAATSGRSFWILDDLGLIRQYEKPIETITLYKPENAVLANGSSELDKTSAEFTGMHSHRGVNPANGIVMYYTLPELKKEDVVTLEIKDEQGNLVRSFTSVPDSTYQEYDSAPPADPVLSKNKGLNRFVWNMRYPTMIGVANLYIESSFRGHKAIPGKYTVTLKSAANSSSSSFEILANPLYPTTAKDYQQYHSVMLAMETELNTMHRMINTLQKKREQLEKLIASLPAEEKFNALKKEGTALAQRMKTWDEEMIQRKSLAYDDVENFPNKFTANYLFLINQTESDIPRVNQPNLKLQQELNAQWATLKTHGNTLLEKDLVEFNKQLWAAGIGPVWEK
jgi:hypothetical protein